MTDDNCITFLIVGLGSRATSDYLPLFTRTPRAKLIGICDTNSGLQSSSPEGVPFFTNLAAAIETTKPRAAIVATPHLHHYEVVSYLARSGVAILKEKPYAMNLTEAKSLSSITQRYDSYLRVAVQRQHNAVFKWVRSGVMRIGALRYYDAHYCLRTAPYGETWRGDKALAGGGAVIDMGYHILDLLCSLFGTPEQVYAREIQGRHDGSSMAEVEEGVSASFEYSAGLHGRIFLSRYERSKRETLTIVGREGSIEATPSGADLINTQGKVIDSIRNPDNYSPIDEMFYSFIHDFGDRGVAAEECRRGEEVMKVTQAIYRSMREKSVVVSHSVGELVSIV